MNIERIIAIHPVQRTDDTGLRRREDCKFFRSELTCRIVSSGACAREPLRVADFLAALQADR